MILPYNAKVNLKTDDGYKPTELSDLRPMSILQGTCDSQIRESRRYKPDETKPGIYNIEFESGKFLVIEESNSVFVKNAADKKGKGLGFPVKDLHPGVVIEAQDGTETVKVITLHYYSLVLFNVDIAEAKEGHGVFVDGITVKA